MCIYQQCLNPSMLEVLWMCCKYSRWGHASCSIHSTPYFLQDVIYFIMDPQIRQQHTKKSLNSHILFCKTAVHQWDVLALKPYSCLKMRCYCRQSLIQIGYKHTWWNETASVDTHVALFQPELPLARLIVSSREATPFQSFAASSSPSEI